MKKNFICLLLALAALIIPASAVDLYVDGQQLSCDVEPTIISGRTLVPMRAIFEALDASVEWDNASRTATANKNGTSVKVTIASKTAYVNQTAQTLDVPAQLIGGRTMVPARFVSESLNSRVLWDNHAKTVYIITEDHESLVVEYLDVGQADCVLLSSGGEYMLIDAGNNDDGDDIIAYLHKAGVNSLNYVVGTHPHEDHIGGMDDVLLSFDVAQVLLADATTNTKTYSDVLDAIESKSLPVCVPHPGDTYRLGNAEITVIAAEPADELNNTSVVLKATYGSTSFLFTGDAETETENQILRRGTDIRCDVLKVGHHGSDTSTGSAFLAAAAPKAAVICCGAGNSYGHPSQTTLDKLSGIPVWRTDLNGTIIAMTDGRRCSITSDKGAASPPQSTAPAAPSTPTVSDEPAAGSSTQTTPSTVYITPTGKRYHYKQSCAGKNAQPSTLSNAKSRGLTPCRTCAS